MTLKELFAASVFGFPEVESTIPIKGATSNIGQVVELKVSPGNGYKGCGVSFPGLNYVTWFYAEEGTDKRHKYMKDLKLTKGGFMVVTPESMSTKFPGFCDKCFQHPCKCKNEG